MTAFLSELQKYLEKENRIDKAESLKTTGFPLFFTFQLTYGTKTLIL